MARFDVIAAQVPDTGEVHDTVDAAKVQGRRRSAISEFVSDGTEGAAAVLAVAKLPLNAYVHNAEVVILNAGPTGLATLGDTDDPDRYLTAIDQDAAVNTITGTFQGTGKGYKIASEAQRTINLTTAGTHSTGDSYRVIIEWAHT